MFQNESYQSESEQKADSGRTSSVNSSKSESSEQTSNAIPTISTEPINLAFKDIFKEPELQVKIADLGNACWTVILFPIEFSFYFKLVY